MPDCSMCWNEWPTLNETPFPQLAGIQVCRNCARSMKQMVAFCRNHGLSIVPQVGTNSLSSEDSEPTDSAASGDEPPPPPRSKVPVKKP